MALITRFTRMFRADLHAVLDRAEEPGVLLKQAVREMEEDADLDQQRIRVLTHELGQIDTRLSDLKQSIHQIDTEMDVCFTLGKDDLARSLIKRKLETRQLIKVLSHKHRSLSDSVTELKTRLDENRQRLESMRQKAELLGEENIHHREQPWTNSHITICDEDVEVALLHEKQQRSSS